MRQENRCTKSDSGSNGSTPIFQMEQFAEMEEVRFPYIEHEKVNELMEQIEAIGNSSEIYDRLGQKLGRRS